MKRRRSERAGRACVALIAVSTAWGCLPQSRAPAPSSARPAELPAALTAWLRPDSTREHELAPGVRYGFVWSAEGPWAIHLVEADLGRCRVRLDLLTAAGRGRAEDGARETVTAMVGRRSGVVIAAVNGDFFTPEGEPVGPEVTALGERPGEARPALAFRPGGAPWIGVVRPAGDSLAGPGWQLRPDGEPGGVRVVAGFPELLDAGARVGDLGVSERPGFAAARHPRSAVAWDPDGRRVWLVVVDGRQGAWSAGMTLPELTRLLEALGAREALNLDGGGSSVLVVNGEPVSRPSDGGGERPVPNALALTDEPGLCPQPGPPSPTEIPTLSSRPGPGSK